MPILEIREAQMAAFREALGASFRSRLEKHLIELDIPSAMIEEHLECGIRAAAELGIVAERDVARWIELMLRHQHSASLDSLPKSARNLLMAYGVPANEKLDRFSMWLESRDAR